MEVKIDLVEKTIADYELLVETSIRERNAIVEQNASAVQELVNAKIQKVLGTLKDEAIKELLGDKLEHIDNNIKVNTDILNVLKSLIVESTPAPEETLEIKNEENKIEEVNE